MSDVEKEYDYLAKLLLIGSGGAGKTQLLTRFADDTFSESHISDDFDFKFRTVDISGKIVKLQVWDLGGSHRFKTTNYNTYYRMAHVIGICFDLCEANELENILQWQQEVDRYTTGNVPVFVIGTKCDRFYRICVDFETIRNFCLSRDVQYFECSAKLNINVEDLFESMARIVVELEKKKLERETPNTVIERKSKPKKNCAFQ